MVSSYRMAPLINSAARGVVNSISRYARRLCSVDGIPKGSNRLVRVATLSSAARMPLPSATSIAAMLCRSWLILRVLLMYSPSTSPLSCAPVGGNALYQRERRGRHDRPPDRPSFRGSVSSYLEGRRTLWHGRRHFGHTPRVAASGEGRFQKGQQTIPRNLWTDQARAEGKNVGVV